MGDDDPRVKQKLVEIRSYAAAPLPNLSLVLMAKFGLTVGDWMTRPDLDARRFSAGARCSRIMA
jgi:hypothetical protein